MLLVHRDLPRVGYSVQVGVHSVSTPVGKQEERGMWDVTKDKREPREGFGLRSRDSDVQYLTPDWIPYGVGGMLSCAFSDQLAKLDHES